MKKTNNKKFDDLLKSSINAAESMENDNQTNMSVISDYLSEYLKSYVLLGYDTNSESVVIIGGKTGLRRDRNIIKKSR